MGFLERVQLLFEGGQVLSILVSGESADRLEQALGSEGALALDAEDGRYGVVLGKIVYVKRFSREARVGFGSA